MVLAVGGDRTAGEGERREARGTGERAGLGVFFSMCCTVFVCCVFVWLCALLGFLSCTFALFLVGFILLGGPCDVQSCSTKRPRCHGSYALSALGAALGLTANTGKGAVQVD